MFTKIVKWCLFCSIVMLYMVFIAESAVDGGWIGAENSLFNNVKYAGNNLFNNGKGYNRPSRGDLPLLIHMMKETDVKMSVKMNAIVIAPGEIVLPDGWEKSQLRKEFARLLADNRQMRAGTVSLGEIVYLNRIDPRFAWEIDFVVGDIPCYDCE